MTRQVEAKQEELEKLFKEFKLKFYGDKKLLSIKDILDVYEAFLETLSPVDRNFILKVNGQDTEPEPKESSQPLHD